MTVLDIICKFVIFFDNISNNVCAGERIVDCSPFLFLFGAIVLFVHITLLYFAIAVLAFMNSV